MSALAVLRMGGLGEPAPIDVVADISPRPLLLMHGSEDRAIPDAHSRELYAQAGEPRQLWIAEGARHAMLYNSHPEEWRRRVLGLLALAFGEPG